MPDEATATVPAPAAAPAAPAAPVVTEATIPDTATPTDTVEDVRDDELPSVDAAIPTPDAAGESDGAAPAPDAAAATVAALAQQFGLSEAAVKALPPAELGKFLAALDARLVSLATPAAPAQPTAPAGQPAAPPAAPGAAPAADAPPISFADKAEEWDEDSVTAATEISKRMAQYVDKRVEQVLSQLGDVIDARAEESRFVNDFESAVTQFATGREEVFGKGSSDALAQNAPTMANRAKLFQTAVALARQYPSLGMPVPKMPELLQRAAAVAFGETMQQHARKELDAAARQRRSQSVGRPSARNGAVSPERSALNLVASTLAKRGVDPRTGESARGDDD